LKTILILSIIVLFLRTSSLARDPLLPDAPDYDEREMVGGEGWSAGDTFLAITLPIVVAITIVLPHIFDGPDEEDYKPLTFSSPSVPRWRMAFLREGQGHAYGGAWLNVWPVSPGLVSSAGTRAKFPTRSTCIDTF